MKISIDDAKQIVNKVTQGEGVSNYTPLEIVLWLQEVVNG